MPAESGDKQLPRPQEVFISYSRKDEEFVRRLQEALRRRNREAWVDWKDIRPTEEWMQAIYAAIEGADTFVFVLTPDSIASVVCGREIAHAVAHNKRMVPIVARDLNANTVPEALAKLNYIWFRESDDFEEATNKLISAFDTDLKWVRSHTRLLTRAIEWDANGKNNSFVLRGDDLRAAEQWLAQAGADKKRQQTPLQTEYIIASRKAADEEEAKVKRTFALADFDLALMYREKSEAVHPRTLAHLARALRTDLNAPLPRQYLVSLLRDRPWRLPQTEQLRHGKLHAASFSSDGRRILTAADFNTPTARVWDTETGKLRSETLRHDHTVFAASFSSDGQRFVTLTYKIVRVWDAESGKPVSNPLCHDGHVVWATFSKDGTRVVTVGQDQDVRVWVVRVWDTESGRCLRELRPGGSVAGAVFSPDGRRVVTASWDKTARIWDVESGEPLGDPLQHEAGVNAACFSVDGQWVVTASEDTTARVWDVETGLPLNKALHHDGSVVTASFSPDSKLVITVSKDQCARIWATETAELLLEPLRHEDTVLEAHLSADGRRVVTRTGKIARLWDVGSGKPLDVPLREGAAGTEIAASFIDERLRVLTSEGETVRVCDVELEKPWIEALGHEENIICARFSADGRRIVTASNDNTARVWLTETGKTVGHPLYHEEIAAATFSGDGEQIVTISADNTARVWDVQSGKPITDPLPHESWVLEANFSPDGNRIVTAASEGIKVWNAKTGKPLGEHDGPALSARFSADGGRIVTLGGALRVWDAESCKLVSESFRPKGTIQAANFNIEQLRIVTSEDSTAQVWDAEAGKPLGRPLCHEAKVTSADFSTDGRRIVTRSEDMTARVWDAESGKPLGQPLRHEGEIVSAEFNVDGQLVVTASSDRKVRIWDAHSGHPLTEPLCHDSELKAATFRPDGRRVLTVSGKSIRVWDVAVDLNTPLPDWVPELAEALGGRHFDGDGQLVPPTKGIFELRQELRGLGGDDFWSRFSQWFFMRGPQRTISPDSKITAGELASQQLPKTGAKPTKE